jgi:crotonobetainyl-CoA:carnitine CoA-transferase CaiB-like acyl-CoA transferase
LDHLRERPEFANNDLRFANRKLINAEINAVTRTNTIEHWINVINAAGIPCGRVMNVKEVFDDPQTQHQQMRITIDHPRHGPLDVLGFPIKFSDEPCIVHRPPPDLGADNEAVLTNLGYSTAQIQDLKSRNVI